MASVYQQQQEEFRRQSIQYQQQLAAQTGYIPYGYTNSSGGGSWNPARDTRKSEVEMLDDRINAMRVKLH